MQTNLLYLTVGVIIGWILNHLMIKHLLSNIVKSTLENNFMPECKEFEEEAEPWHKEPDFWKNNNNNDKDI
jgi:hypothetical protein